MNAIMIMVRYLEANRTKLTVQNTISPITRFLHVMATDYNGEINTQTVKEYLSDLFEKSPKSTATVVKSFVSCFVDFLNESGLVKENIFIEKKPRGRKKKQTTETDETVPLDVADTDEDVVEETTDVEEENEDSSCSTETDDNEEEYDSEDNEDEDEEDEDDEEFDGVPLGCRVDDSCDYLFDRSKMSNDYYGIFEVSVDADDETLKKAYLAKAREFHPDRNRREDATQIMASIAHIYDILSDETERRRYNIAMGYHPILKRTTSKPDDYLVYYPQP